MKKIFFTLCLGLITQLAFCQDKHIKSFIKNYKDHSKATYLSANTANDIETDFDGIFELIGKIGHIKMVTIENSSRVISDFKRLESKLNTRYETMFKTTSNSSGINVYSDEDHGYIYAMIKGDDQYIVISLETN